MPTPQLATCEQLPIGGGKGLFMGLFSQKDAEPSSNPLRLVTLGDGNQVQISSSIDCIGNSCPRPQLMTKNALSAAFSGAVIEILIDNASSIEAIPPMLPDLGATHLESIQGEKFSKIYVRKD